MRVFKHGRIVDKIIGEIINIESGKLLYEDGFATNTVKSPLYPSIELDGIVTTIRSSIGFIYLPNSLDMKEFIEKQIIPVLVEKDHEHDYLSNYARLERKSGQFTAMKAKSTFQSSLVGDSHTSDHKRVFIINLDSTDIGKSINHNRFTWFVFPISVLVKSIESFENSRFPPTTQFVSMIYDINNQLNAENNEKMLSNITFKNFRVCQHLISFNPLKDKLQKELDATKEKDKKKEEKKVSAERQAFLDQKKCPDCQKQFKSKGGLTRHVNAQACIKKKKLLEQRKKLNEKIKCPYSGPAGIISRSPQSLAPAEKTEH